MNPNTLKVFAQLCESFLPEASSSLSLVAQQPGGKQVIQHLHSKHLLSHDQNYQSVPKISWSELKDSYKGAWVLIQGTKGTGAIKASGGNTGSYRAVASTGGEVRELQDSRGGNVIDFLKGEIGNLRSFYVGKETGKVKDVQKSRADLQKSTSTAMNQDTLVMKFKPLWVKAVTAAIADVKGHIANQIKNDAFEKAQNKLNHLQRLDGALATLESGSGETPDTISAAVSAAIHMAASHYYPDDTGEITRHYRGSYSSSHAEGPKKVLDDIAKGDTSKLGTILTFFKRSLISG